METVVLPAIKGASIAANTKNRYLLCYRLLMGQCGGNVKKRQTSCRHRYSLNGMSIHDATRPRALKNCLEEIAELHGKRNAEQSKTVAKRYLCGNLLIDELIEYNPVASLDLDFAQARPIAYRRGGRALSLVDYQRVIQYLLDADPTTVEDRSGRQGRWGTAYLEHERSILIDFVLCQATTGMRTSELASRTGETAEVDADFNVIFTLSPAETKTRAGREVPIIDPRVSQRIAARLAALPDPTFPLFPSPEDPSKVWEPSSRNRRIAVFYKRMASDLSLPVFERERGHFWRSCLNTVLYDTLPEATRIRLLGHTSAVNRKSYTAVTDTHSVVEAASAVLLP
ncbi:site-specific integrase [uncultured Mobiluncus sp.]|uniref:tyrosine-type recombinase/integrase n=1 Tax=uncultured Mobiluncus sp. TaxID=293425 RepID=UPI00261EF210|nr:site-specific integrase [uncultured Mobiluncus sp.]